MGARAQQIYRKGKGGHSMLERRGGRERKEWRKTDCIANGPIN